MTLTNLTAGQLFSPPVVATTGGTKPMFAVGGKASAELAKIAQAGDNAPMVAMVKGQSGTTDVVDVARPITPSGSTKGGFSDTVTITIKGDARDRLSLASMLACTNDGIWGVNSFPLPRREGASYTVPLAGYDAGVERNTQLSKDLADGCSALGPVALPGDPNGNDDVTPAQMPAQPIYYHTGVRMHGDLTPQQHGWRGPVARLTVKRLR